MKKIIRYKKASILVFTLLFLSIITILTQQLVRSVLIGYSFSSSQIFAQQARELALGGIQLAIAQLKFDKNVKMNEDKEKTEDEIFKCFLSSVLPNINRWQEFNLKEEFDGIDGQVKFCISCEDGKININKAFDFNKNEFKENYKKLFAGLKIDGKLKEGEIEKKLTEFFKKRKKPLDDISELSNVSGLEKINIFYDPPLNNLDKKKLKANSSIYLQDLFTIWSEKEELQFLFLSDSLLAILGLRRPLASDAVELKDKFKLFINSFTKDWLKNLETNWNNFIPIYGSDIKILKLSEKILAKEFVPKVYSVLSCGKVKNIEQKLLVVLQEVEVGKKEEESTKDSVKQQIALEKQKEEKPSKDFQIVRMYWL